VKIAILNGRLFYKYTIQVLQPWIWKLFLACLFHILQSPRQDVIQTSMHVHAFMFLRWLTAVLGEWVWFIW